MKCHSGDLMSDEKFHNVGFAQVGPGTGSGPLADHDFGRANITGRREDRYAFRTPTLLNTWVTGPWGHNGAYATLEDTIRAHVDPVAALERYDFTKIPFTPSPLNALFNSQEVLDELQRVPGYEFVDLSDDQIADLVEFMKALTDPCVESRECLAPWDPFNAGIADENMGLLHPREPGGCSLVEIDPACD